MTAIGTKTPTAIIVAALMVELGLVPATVV